MKVLQLTPNPHYSGTPLNGHPSTADTCDKMDSSKSPERISIELDVKRGRGFLLTAPLIYVRTRAFTSVQAHVHVIGSEKWVNFMLGAEFLFSIAHNFKAVIATVLKQGKVIL